MNGMMSRSKGSWKRATDDGLEKEGDENTGRLKGKDLD